MHAFSARLDFGKLDVMKSKTDIEMIRFEIKFKFYDDTKYYL